VGDSRHLIFPFYHQIIAKRTPPPGMPVTALAPKPLRREDGWLLSPDDWDTPYPTIAPFAEYKGDPTKAGWLPDAYTAYTARAYTAGSGPTTPGRTAGPPVVITQPPCAGDSCTPRSAGVKSLVLFEVQVMGEAPASVDLWDGDRRLFAVPGPPFRVNVTDWPPGVHAIHALAIYAGGKKAVSAPRTVVVTRPGMSSGSCRRDGGTP
jgi:hypothetical protein